MLGVGDHKPVSISEAKGGWGIQGVGDAHSSDDG